MKIAFPGASACTVPTTVSATGRVVPSLPQPASASTAVVAAAAIRAPRRIGRESTDSQRTRTKQPSAPSPITSTGVSLTRSETARPARSASTVARRGRIVPINTSAARQPRKIRMRYQWSVADSPREVQAVSEISEERAWPAADRAGDVARAAESGIEPDEHECHDDDGRGHERKASRREREPTEPQPQHARVQSRRRGCPRRPLRPCSNRSPRARAPRAGRASARRRSPQRPGRAAGGASRPDSPTP